MTFCKFQRPSLFSQTRINHLLVLLGQCWGTAGSQWSTTRNKFGSVCFTVTERPYLILCVRCPQVNPSATVAKCCHLITSWHFDFQQKKFSPLRSTVKVWIPLGPVLGPLGPLLFLVLPEASLQLLWPRTIYFMVTLKSLTLVLIYDYNL